MTETLPPAPRRDAAEASQFRLLTSIEAAGVLSIGRRTLQEQVAAGKIGCIHIGRSVRFHPDDLAAFIERNRRKATGWKSSQGGRTA